MIRCEKAQEMLDLSFGQRQLPAELTAHLKECDACAAYRVELMELDQNFELPAESLFSPSELERVALAVDAKIQPGPVTSILPLQWMQPMVRVAAAIVLVAASFFTYQLGRNGVDIDNTTVAEVSTTEYGSLSSLWVEDLEENLNEEMITVLIDDYAESSDFGAGENLVGDITEEEYEYLLDNFEVGDLL